MHSKYWHMHSVMVSSGSVTVNGRKASVSRSGCCTELPWKRSNDRTASTQAALSNSVIRPCRELGCVTRGSAGGKNKPGKLEVALLPPCAPPKALKEYFPEIQVRKPVGRRRG